MSIIRGNRGWGRFTDNYESRIIQNMYFIESQTKHKTVIYEGQSNENLKSAIQILKTLKVR